MQKFYSMLKDFVMGIDPDAENVYEVLDKIFFFWAN